jgi:hypothetical protein
VAAVQYTFTHKQYAEYGERDVHNNKRIGKCGPCTVFTVHTLQLRQKHGRTSVSVIEQCPDIPVAVVQSTFTHKQYTEEHNKTEYIEQDILNNKNT